MRDIKPEVSILFDDFIKYKNKLVHMVLMDDNNRAIGVFMDGQQVGYIKIGVEIDSLNMLKISTILERYDHE